MVNFALGFVELDAREVLYDVGNLVISSGFLEIGGSITRRRVSPCLCFLVSFQSPPLPGEISRRRLHGGFCALVSGASYSGDKSLCNIVQAGCSTGKQPDDTAVEDLVTMPESGGLCYLLERANPTLGVHRVVLLISSISGRKDTLKNGY